MAIPISIDKILKENTVEYARIEFKENWNPEPILHTLCAFANDIDNWGGGYIIVGVKENKGMPVFPVTGIPTATLDRIQKNLLELCHRIKPFYTAVCEPVVYEGENLLLIWAPGGYDRPYQVPVSLSKGNKKFCHYIRKFSSTLKADNAEIKELHDISSTIPFDDRKNPQSKLSDLKVSLITEFLGEIKSSLFPKCYDLSVHVLADSLKIAEGPTECFKPLNVGLMFFNDIPENFFRCARIEVILIPDATGEGMLEYTFNGPIHRQLIDALTFIKNSVIAEKVFKTAEKAEAIRIFNYPYAAIEEILCNAVYHKSYQIAEPVTVRVERKKIVISSCPGPDRSISSENLDSRHLIARRYRNRRIGDFLKELMLIEGRNTGVPTILRALEENGSPLPVFETDEERSFFSATIEIHEKFLSEKQVVVKGDKVKKSYRSREQIQKEILIFLKKGLYSQNELSKLMGYASISKTFTAVVASMIENGLIKYYGTETKKSPNAKLQRIKKA